MQGVWPATESAYASRGRADSNQALMVSEEFTTNRVEIVLNCADATPERGPGGVIVAICQVCGRRPACVPRFALSPRGDECHHRPVAFLVERGQGIDLFLRRPPFVQVREREAAADQ